VQAGVGDLVAVGAGNALDELVAAEPPQVVGHLPGADIGQAAQFGGEVAQVAVGEAAATEPKLFSSVTRLSGHSARPWSSASRTCSTSSTARSRITTRVSHRRTIGSARPRGEPHLPPEGRDDRIDPGCPDLCPKEDRRSERSPGRRLLGAEANMCSISCQLVCQLVPGGHLGGSLGGRTALARAGLGQRQLL
jgi:hypothetical protein